MKKLCIGLTMLIIASSCSSDMSTEPISFNTDKITFIGNFDNPENEIVIKTMIRQSLIESEYNILRHNDTLTFNSIGRTFFKIGFRNTILDTAIVERGDIILVSLLNDSLRFVPEKSDMDSNKSWLNNYHYAIEDSIAALLDPIKDKSANLDFLKTPLRIFNDHENQDLIVTHKYVINRTAYQNSKTKIDKEFEDIYLEFDSMIVESELNQGAKQILKNELFNSTLDKFRRMGSTLQPWMYDKMKDDLSKNCANLPIVICQTFT